MLKAMGGCLPEMQNAGLAPAFVLMHFCRIYFTQPVLRSPAATPLIEM